MRHAGFSVVEPRIEGPYWNLPVGSASSRPKRRLYMPTNKLTPEIIIAAIDGFESKKRQIDEQIAELRAMLPGGPTESAAMPEAAKGRRRKVSAAARKRIGDAQRKRWAASKAEAEPVRDKPKRKLSAAGRANIVAALRKRWAAKKAGATKTAPAAVKKAAAKNAAARKAAPVKAAKKTSTKKAAAASGKAETQPTA